MNKEELKCNRIIRLSMKSVNSIQIELSRSVLSSLSPMGEAKALILMMPSSALSAILQKLAKSTNLSGDLLFLFLFFFSVTRSPAWQMFLRCRRRRRRQFAFTALRPLLSSSVRPFVTYKNFVPKDDKNATARALALSQKPAGKRNWKRSERGRKKEEGV